MDYTVLGAVARHIVKEIHTKTLLDVSWSKPLADEFLCGYKTSAVKHCTQTFCIPDGPEDPFVLSTASQIDLLVEKINVAISELQQRNISVNEILVVFEMVKRKDGETCTFFPADAHVLYTPPDDDPQYALQVSLIDGISEGCGGGVLCMNSVQYLSSAFVGASSVCSNYVFAMNIDMLSDTSNAISLEEAMLAPGSDMGEFVSSRDALLDKFVHDVKQAKSAAEDGGNYAVSFCVVPLACSNTNVQCFSLCARVGTQREICIG